MLTVLYNADKTFQMNTTTSLIYLSIHSTDYYSTGLLSSLSLKMDGERSKVRIAFNYLLHYSRLDGEMISKARILNTT